MSLERQHVAGCRFEMGDCRDYARIHRQLAARESDGGIAAAHVRWAQAYEARAGKVAEDAEPGDPCGMITGTICDGTLQCWIDVKGAVPSCKCHLSPPCGACLEAPLVCDTCEAEVP